MNYPEGFVTTKIGKLRIMANGRNTLYVDGNFYEATPAGRVANVLTVRGCEYRGTLHLTDYGNGYELSRDDSGPYISRNGHYGHGVGVSTSARKVIAGVMQAAALEWIKANPLAPIMAGIEEEDDNEIRLGGKIRDKAAELRKLEEELAQTTARKRSYQAKL